MRVEALYRDVAGESLESLRDEIPVRQVELQEKSITTGDA